MRAGVRRLHIYRVLFYPIRRRRQSHGGGEEGGAWVGGVHFGIGAGRGVPKLSGRVLAVSVVDRPGKIQRFGCFAKIKFLGKEGDGDLAFIAH